MNYVIQRMRNICQKRKKDKIKRKKKLKRWKNNLKNKGFKR